MVIVTGNHWERDFALLKTADILILSSAASTFSWWAAYLNENLRFVVYNSPVVDENSSLGSQLTVADYMLPNWVPLSLDDTD